MVEFNNLVLGIIAVIILANFVVALAIPAHLCGSLEETDLTSLEGQEVDLSILEASDQNPLFAFFRVVTGQEIANCLPNPFGAIYLFLINLINLVGLIEVISFIRELIGFT